MPDENNKTLKYKHGEKPMENPFIIYADLECLHEKTHSWQNNPEKSYTKTKYTHSGCSLFTNCSFDSTELHSEKSKLDCYRGKDCMKKFCKDLRKHTIRIVNYEKKEMIPLTDEENQFYEEKKVCSICKKLCSTDND